jgi:quinol monooxygenase YgiN
MNEKEAKNADLQARNGPPSDVTKAKMFRLAFRFLPSLGLSLLLSTGVLALFIFSARYQAANATTPPSPTDRVARTTNTSTDPGPLIDVIHIDVVPQFTNQAVLLLKAYRRASLDDAGSKRIDILQQIGRPNHFTVVEEWKNRTLYDKHVGASHTIQFRTALAPMLGAPFDERPHLSID